MLQRRRPRYKPDGLPIPKAPPRVRHKPGRYENMEHEAWLHDWCCVLVHTGECYGPIEVHHLKKPWIGVGGGSVRSDSRNGAPHCLGHHREFHDEWGDEFAFYEAKAGDPLYGQKQARKLWEESPHWEEVP